MEEVFLLYLTIKKFTKKKEHRKEKGEKQELQGQEY